MDAHHGHCPLLQDPSEWILGKPVPAMETVINKKDFACTENHTHLQQSAVLVEPSILLGMEVLAWGDMSTWWYKGL